MKKKISLSGLGSRFDEPAQVFSKTLDWFEFRVFPLDNQIEIYYLTS